MGLIAFVQAIYKRKVQDTQSCRLPCQSLPLDVPPRESRPPSQSLPLDVLPREILQDIRDLLPLSTAASFSLTSRNLLSILGNGSFILLNSRVHAHEKIAFLADLQRDLQHWRLCYPCSLFHPAHPTSFQGFIVDQPDCVKISGSIYFTTGFKLYFQDAQLLMNRHRSGVVSEVSLKSLSYHFENCFEGKGRGLQTTITPCILADKLEIRLTSILRLSRSSWDVELIVIELPEICPHVSLFKYVRCYLSHRKGQFCFNCNKEKHCEKCMTRFDMDIQELATSEMRVHLGVVKPLGFCKTPFDPDWYRHCDSLPDIRKVSSDQLNIN